MHYKLVALPDSARGIVLAFVVVYLLVRAGLIFFGRKQPNSSLAPGTPCDYGLAGGAICSTCGRPFALSLLGLKIGLGTKLVRCPFCGKVSLVRRAALEDLRAAEARELGGAEPVVIKSEDEKMSDLLEGSRYMDRK